MNNENTNLFATETSFSEFTLEERLKLGFSIEFSKCIVQRRRELGWTQAELAEQSGVNRVTIAKLEKFHRTASIDVVLKLLHALGMEIRFVQSSQDN